MRKVVFLSLVALVVFGSIGCAVMPIIHLKYPAKTDNKDIVAAAVLVLQEYSFGIDKVEPEIGFVTAMRRAQTPFPAVVLDSSSRVDWIELSIMADRDACKLIMRPVRLFGVGEGIPTNFNDDENQMLHDIALKIVTKLGGTVDDIEWEGPAPQKEIAKPVAKQHNPKKFLIICGIITLTVGTVSILSST